MFALFMAHEPALVITHPMVVRYTQANIVWRQACLILNSPRYTGASLYQSKPLPFEAFLHDSETVVWHADANILFFIFYFLFFIS
jgi:hypothetical protein